MYSIHAYIAIVIFMLFTHKKCILIATPIQTHYLIFVLLRLLLLPLALSISLSLFSTLALRFFPVCIQACIYVYSIYMISYDIQLT